MYSDSKTLTHWNKNSKSLKAIGLAAFYALACMVIAFDLMGSVLWQLNSVQMDWSGDGFKNYFSFAYQYRYGQGLWFEGMQYPYGDLLTYADGQPTVLLLFKALKSVGIDISGYELLVVQGMPILGLFVSCFFLHKILRHFDVNTYWTMITVVFCLALSPQLFRFNSHFALAYTFVVPCIWWLIAKWEQKHWAQWLFICISTAILFLFAYVHPYNLLICSVFLCSYFVIASIRDKKPYPSLVLSALLPVFLFMLVNGILDPYSDRPENPYGIMAYKTEVSDLFPFYGWFHKTFASVKGIRASYHEGYCYTGALLFITPLLLMYYINHRNSINISKALNTAILSALLCLAFAMGIHMLLGGETLIELISPLKQFRSLGRFSWPFYYIAFVYLSILVFKISKCFKSKAFRWSVLGCVVALWAIDAYSFHKNFRIHFNKYKSSNILLEDTRVSDFLESKSLDADYFQAVLPLPVPVEGAEKFNIAYNWFVKTALMPYVFQSQTPMVGAFMSRTSLSSILSQLQLGSSQYIHKKAADHLKDKAILVAIAESDTTEYMDLLTDMDYMGQIDEVQLYKADKSHFTKTVSIDSMVLNAENILAYNNFPDGSESGLRYQTGKRFQSSYTLAEIQLDSTNETIRFSVWYKIEATKTQIPTFEISFYEDENKIEALSYRDSDIKRIEVLDEWIQLDYSLTAPTNCNKLIWNIYCNELLIDHALVYKGNSEFSIDLEDGYLIHNGRIAEFIKKEE